MLYKNIEEIKGKLNEFSNSKRDLSADMLFSIISQLPKEFSDFIESAFIHKRIPKEYMLSSILYVISSSIGLTFFINALGYKNYANLYFAIIGSRGDAKSEAMKMATSPLKKLDDIKYADYLEKLKNYDREEGEEPKRKQCLIQNATIEAAHKIHFENPNSVGICIDEIYALIEKMGNPNSRDGLEWRTFLLEGYTNGYVDVSRKTTQSFRISDTYPTFLGGLQHQFIPKLLANGNLESGFVDRLLFTPKLTNNNKISRVNMSQQVISNYEASINNVLAYKQQSEREDEPVKQFEITASEEALELIYNYTQELLVRQNGAKPIIKEYMSKMQISIHKLCIVIFMMSHSSKSTFASVLDKSIVELAIDLNEFYLMNFDVVLGDNSKEVSIFPTTEQVISLGKKNNCSQKAIAEVTGLSKGQVSKLCKKEGGNQKLETRENDNIVS